MNLQFEITRDEHLEACFAAGRTRGGAARLRRFAGYMTVLLGVILWVVPEMARLVGPAVVILLGLAILIVPVWTAYSRVEKHWEESVSKKEPFTVTVDKNGLQIRSTTWS